MGNEIVTGSPEKLAVIFENNTQMPLTASNLEDIVFDMRSWLSFWVMLRTGKPALMTCYMGSDRRPSHMKVARLGTFAHDATFETV